MYTVRANSVHSYITCKMVWYGNIQLDPSGESVYTSPFFNKNRFQALSSPQISETDVPDIHQPIVTSVPQGHQYVPICDICVKPHKKLISRSAGSKIVEYWVDIEPIKCWCYEENGCNCIYNERRDDVLPPKPDYL